MPDKHEHQWGPGKAQKLELPATWYWLKGCECGAILMEPAPKDLHLLFEQIEVLERDRTLRAMIRP
jgi:hypothetical protein